MEHLGGFLRPAHASPVPALSMEFQLVAVLDDRRAARGAGVQYQYPHYIPQHLVVPYRRDCRPTWNDVLLLLRARRAGGGAGVLPCPPGGGNRRGTPSGTCL